MTLKELVECLMSHPLYQDGKAAEVEVYMFSATVMGEPETVTGVYFEDDDLGIVALLVADPNKP